MDEIRQVLANWLREASPVDRLPAGTDAPDWVAQQFVRWWSARMGAALDDVDQHAGSLEAELVRLGGWQRTELALSMEEVTHLREALADLRAAALVS